MAGLGDLTYGNPTSLPWGWRFEDGIVRHPTALYEIGFLLCLIPLLRQQKQLPSGTAFRLFIWAYLLFRFAVEFLKPPFGQPAAAVFVPLVPGLWGPFTAIQWAALAGMAVYASSLRHLKRQTA